jgi:hypothetical protein
MGGDGTTNVSRHPVTHHLLPPCYTLNMPSSKRKLKQQKRRTEKRAAHRQELSRTPAEELLGRIALERRVRHEQSSEKFREEQERLWLAEERRRARKQRAKAS